jgi:hypothetical protein
MSLSRMVLAMLQTKHVYQGTVPAHVKEARRRKNKAARRSRRINRKVMQ